MNNGDKVRIKRDTVSWGGNTITEGTVGVVEMVDWEGDYVLVDDLVGVRGDKGIRSSDLEVILEAKGFKVGDRVKILASATQFLSDTIGRLGTVIAADAPRSLRVVVDDYTNGEARSAWYYSEEELELIPEEKQTIEFGDTVKAIHAESGSVVQGVAVYTNFDQDNFEINVSENGFGTLDLYTYQGWEFELVAKKVVTKPEVGDGFMPGLPVGTVIEAVNSNSHAFRTREAWINHEGQNMSEDGEGADTGWNPDVWKIVYLPPSASE